MTKSVIKPCPFCGNDATQQMQMVEGWINGERNKVFYVVGCEYCKVAFRGNNQQEVIDKWNKRVVQNEMSNV